MGRSVVRKGVISLYTAAKTDLSIMLGTLEHCYYIKLSMRESR